MANDVFSEALSAMRLRQMSKMPMWAEDQVRGLTPGFYPGADYDYWNALKFGVQREGMMNGHLSSRVPQTGLILKNPNHPTFWKTIQGEKSAGYELYVGSDGRIYSRRKKVSR